MGANFVLQKPITVVSASRCFHAALNFMLKERRRYFRQPVKMHVKLQLDGKSFTATSTNVSEGGIALQLPDGLSKGATLQLKFTLPGSDIHLDVAAEVAWTNGKGLSGLRFQHIPKSSQTELENWLNAHMEQHFPGSTVRIASVD